jgi:hypothetical protein
MNKYVSSSLFLATVLFLASCGLSNTNSEELTVDDPTIELSSSVTEDQKDAMGYSSKNTCKKTCKGVEYTLGGCWIHKGKPLPLHCKDNGKRIEQWLGDCSNRSSVTCLGLQYWKVK